jgi:hypothetical protein
LTQPRTRKQVNANENAKAKRLCSTLRGIYLNLSFVIANLATDVRRIRSVSSALVVEMCVLELELVEHRSVLTCAGIWSLL